MSQTKMKLKFFVPILAAVIALCATVLVGCNKDSGSEHGQTYYLYDESEEKFDYNEYVFIDGEKCTIHVKGEDGMRDLNIDGKVTYEDNKVSGSGGIIVTKLSDFLAKDGLNDLYEELGVTKLDMDFTANIKCEFEGVKYSNAIVMTKQSLTIRGFTGLLSMFNGTQSSSQREVYCKKGETPDLSVNITIDCNGGTLDGKSSVVMRTDKSGRLDLSKIEPLRDEYAFIGFSYYKDFNGYIFRDYITSDEDKTIYAYWRETIVITYNINSTEYKVDGNSVVRVGKGTEVYRPKIVPIVDNPTTRFKDWYVGNDLCFKWSFSGTMFYEDTNAHAEWYSASEIAAYNNNLPDLGRDAIFYIHYRTSNYSVRDIGSSGGSSMVFFFYSVNDGKQDRLLGQSAYGFNTSDKTGYIFEVFSMTAFFSDLYMEISDNGEVVGSVIIPKSQLGTGATHIFLDESNLNTYRLRW